MVDGRWWMIMVDGGWWMDRYWKTYLIPNGFIVGAIPCGCPLYESFSFGWECIHFGQPYFLGYKSYWVNFDYYGVTAEYWVNAVYWATTRDCPYGRTDGRMDGWMVDGGWWMVDGLERLTDYGLTSYCRPSIHPPKADTQGDNRLGANQQPNSLTDQLTKD